MALRPDIVFGNFGRCVLQDGVWYRMDARGLFVDGSAMLLMLQGYRPDPELNHETTEIHPRLSTRHR